MNYEFRGSEERIRTINSNFLPTFKWVKHSQWVIFNRRYVKILNELFPLMRMAFGNMIIPDESAYGIMLDILGLLPELDKTPILYVEWNQGTRRCPAGKPHRNLPKTYHAHELTHTELEEIRRRGGCFLRKVCPLEEINPRMLFNTE